MPRGTSVFPLLGNSCQSQPTIGKWGTSVLLRLIRMYTICLFRFFSIPIIYKSIRNRWFQPKQSDILNQYTNIRVLGPGWISDKKIKLDLTALFLFDLNQGFSEARQNDFSRIITVGHGLWLSRRRYMNKQTKKSHSSYQVLNLLVAVSSLGHAECVKMEVIRRGSAAVIVLSLLIFSIFFAIWIK